MVRCRKCPAEATFDSPDHLCDEHWAEWWVEGLDCAPEIKAELLAETLDDIRRRYGPGVSRQDLEEAAELTAKVHKLRN